MTCSEYFTAVFKNTACQNKIRSFLSQALFAYERVSVPLLSIYWQTEYFTEPTDSGDWHAIGRARVGCDHGTAY